ncbi:hypothetical protein PHMEG_00041806 [Phytophthora megakarya]|uniref:Uncharacterized protein n=1 Tax=Phytophthora megakarya TaxID=4795 RepID=A0A225UAX6_9STRA|nr:hypothetical protein PHMEG_00041806 [Phytophthora megakarya]
MTRVRGYKNPPAIARRLEYTGANSGRRDVERLDAGLYWVPMELENPPTDTSELISLSSHELEALRKGPARWTYRTAMHSFGLRKNDK